MVGYDNVLTNYTLIKIKLKKMVDHSLYNFLRFFFNAVFFMVIKKNGRRIRKVNAKTISP